MQQSKLITPPQVIFLQVLIKLVLQAWSMTPATRFLIATLSYFASQVPDVIFW